MKQKNHTDAERLQFLLVHDAKVVQTDCGYRVQRIEVINRKTRWLGRRCADPRQAIDTAIDQAEDTLNVAKKPQ